MSRKFAPLLAQNCDADEKNNAKNVLKKTSVANKLTVSKGQTFIFRGAALPFIF